MVESKDLLVLGGYTYWVYRTFFTTSRSSITPIITSFVYKIFSTVADQDGMGARGNHTATLLPNGQVLVAGGRDGFGFGNVLNTSSLYTPAQGNDPDSWTAVANQNMGARSLHTATLLPNGKVLVAGGYDASGVALNTSSLYDPNVYSVVVFPVFSNGTGTINGTNVTTNVEFEIKDPSLTQTLIVTSITGNVAQLIAT
jgi:hypothetical protein